MPQEIPADGGAGSKPDADAKKPEDRAKAGQGEAIPALYVERGRVWRAL